MTLLMNHVIRPYRPDDAPALAETRWQSVQALGAKAYTPEQIVAWLPARESVAKVRSHFEDGRRAWVACAEAAPDLAIGAIDLERDGHIDYLYLRPNAAGQGLATQLLQHVITTAEADGFTRLYTEASELARPVFARRGFSVTHRREFDLRGVSIHNHAMERALGERRT